MIGLMEICSSCSDKDIANKRDEKTEEKSIDNGKKICKYDHLMSRHMSMNCEVCDHPIHNAGQRKQPLSESTQNAKRQGHLL